MGTLQSFMHMHNKTSKTTFKHKINCKCNDSLWFVIHHANCIWGFSAWKAWNVSQRFSCSNFKWILSILWIDRMGRIVLLKRRLSLCSNAACGRQATFWERFHWMLVREPAYVHPFKKVLMSFSTFVQGRSSWSKMSRGHSRFGAHLQLYKPRARFVGQGTQKCHIWLLEQQACPS